MRYTAETDADSKLTTLVSATQDEPVFIERDQQEVAVLISSREYGRLRSTARLDFEHFCDSISDKAEAKGLPEAKLDELLSNA